MLYADDIALVAGVAGDVRCGGANAEKWKFRFNSGKSKVMVIGRYGRSVLGVLEGCWK